MTELNPSSINAYIMLKVHHKKQEEHLKELEAIAVEYIRHVDGLNIQSGKVPDVNIGGCTVTLRANKRKVDTPQSEKLMNQILQIRTGNCNAKLQEIATLQSQAEQYENFAAALRQEIESLKAEGTETLQKALEGAYEDSYQYSLAVSMPK